MGHFHDAQKLSKSLWKYFGWLVGLVLFWKIRKATFGFFSFLDLIDTKEPGLFQVRKAHLYSAMVKQDIGVDFYFHDIKTALNPSK